MPLSVATLNFDKPLNTSLQIGDIMYFSNTSVVPGTGITTTTTNNIKRFGVVKGLNNPQGLTNDQISVDVAYDDQDMGQTLPSVGAFIMFEKDKRVNSSSLIGYYASVTFKNYSTEKAEIFAVSSNYTESSY